MTTESAIKARPGRPGSFPAGTETVAFLTHIPRQTRDAIKVLAAERETTMNALVDELVSKAIAKIRNRQAEKA